MNIHLSKNAPAELPRIDYFCVDDNFAAHISEAMTLDENKAKFYVEFIPVDTPEARRTAALEWAAYLAAKGNAETKRRGAYAVINGRDESPQALESFLERHLTLPTPDFPLHALSKIVHKTDTASSFDLARTYYEPAVEQEPITTLGAYLQRVREVEAEKFMRLSPEDQEAIVNRAQVLRVSPSGFNDDEALHAAINEMIPATAEEIGVSDEQLAAIVASLGN